MLVTKFDPFKDLMNVNKLFNSYPTVKEDSGINAFIPNVNTREDDKAYYIEADMPGIKKEDIDINVDKNILSISGERKFKEEKSEKDYYKLETSFGKYQRSFTLPDNIDYDTIDAKCEDGVLEIVIHKIEEATQKKRIAIK